MFFTFINDIINVWYNDAHKLSVFYNILILPLYIIFIKDILASFSITLKSLFKASPLKVIGNISLYVIVFLNFIFFISGCVGLFQIILPDYIDAVIRSGGIFLITISILFYIRFFIKHKRIERTLGFINNGFYGIVRHPEYLLFLLFSLGLSFCVLSVLSITITILFQIPFTIILAVSEERKISLEDESYFDYKNETPMFIPEFRIIQKKINK